MPRPVRSSAGRAGTLRFLLTGMDLRGAAAAAGLGYRIGEERRNTLRALLDQDAGATLGWLASHARCWADLHAAQPPIGGHDPRTGGHGALPARPAPWPAADRLAEAR